MDINLSAEQRSKLDQIFMQVVLDAQAQIQQTNPTQSGSLAAMFHRETVSDGLQGCAMLIAGWNAGKIDAAGLNRSLKAVRALGLEELAGRLERLPQIAAPS